MKRTTITIVITGDEAPVTTTEVEDYCTTCEAYGLSTWREWLHMPVEQCGRRLRDKAEGCIHPDEHHLPS